MYTYNALILFNTDFYIQFFSYMENTMFLLIHIKICMYAQASTNIHIHINTYTYTDT